MATALKDRIFECEVKRRRLKQGGGYEPFWKTKTVAEALADNDTEFRCKDCHGEVKVLGKTSRVGAAAYVEHKLASDAASCPSSLASQNAPEAAADTPEGTADTEATSEDTNPSNGASETSESPAL